MSSAIKHAIADRGAFRWSTLLRRWETLLLAVLVLVVALGSVSLKEFLDPNNLADSTFNFSEKALIALAMTLLIIVREIDVSVAGILAVAAVAMGYANTQGVPAAGLAAIGIGVGAICGGLNGLLVTRFGIPSIVVTIGTMSLYRGIALVVLGDQAYTNYPDTLSDWGQGYVFGLIPRECWIEKARMSDGLIDFQHPAFGPNCQIKNARTFRSALSSELGPMPRCRRRNRTKSSIHVCQGIDRSQRE